MHVKKIIYVHRSAFPGPKAHHAAMLKMLDSFLKIEGLSASLVLRKYQRDFTDNIKDYFGLTNDVKIKAPPYAGFLPFRLDFFWRRSLESEFRAISEHFPRGEAVIYFRYSGVTGKRMADYARKSGLPFFCEVHTQIKSRKEVAYLKEMKGIVVITDWLRGHLVDMGIESRKILTAPSGIDVGFYDKKRQCSKERIREKLSLPSDRKLVVYTGKPYKGRGAEILIESSKFLGDSVLVLIVGALPEDLKRLRALVEQNGLQDKVKIEGHIPAYQVPSYQIGADVLVMPYSQDWDLKLVSSPVKMFEYMASGNPVVSSDFPNIREALSEENSVLVPPDNPRLLAGGIIKCLEDTDLASRISANALKCAKSQYGWDNRAAKVTGFINSQL